MRARTLWLLLTLPSLALAQPRPPRRIEPPALAPRGVRPPRYAPRVFACPYPAEVIRRVVVARLDDLRACYEAAGALRTPSRAVLRWSIEADGTVPSATVAHDDPALDGLAACIVGVVRSFRFPADPVHGAVTITYPLHIDPEP